MMFCMRWDVCAVRWPSSTNLIHSFFCCRFNLEISDSERRRRGRNSTATPPPPPTSTADLDSRQQALNYSTLAAAAAAAASSSASTAGTVNNGQETSLSSTETLLRNIQGLLKVAADNSRQQERQINLEKGEHLAGMQTSRTTFALYTLFDWKSCRVSLASASLAKHNSEKADND